MKVTVAVLTYNEEANIPDILSSLEAQTWPRENFEVLIVDNGSSDKTLAVLEPFARRMGNVRIVVNPVKGIAPGRNVAIKEAKHPFVAFTDADVIVPATWLETLVGGYHDLAAKEDRIAAVGSGNIPVRDGGAFLDAVGITLNSFWGSHGSAQGMIFSVPTRVDHIPTLNILYDKRAVESVGGFDENFRMVCEDPELNHRLTKAGWKLYYLPGAVVRHKMRPDLKSWLKNVFLYGRGRTQIIRKHPDHFRPMYLAPPLIVLALLTVPLSVFHPIFLLPLIYALPPGVIAWSLCRKARRMDCLEDAWAILALNPIAYGLGMMFALWKPKT